MGIWPLWFEVFWNVGFYNKKLCYHCTVWCVIQNLANSVGTSCTTTHTDTHTPFNGPWSTTTRVDRYQKKHSPTHTHPDRWTSFINFLRLLWSIASSLFNLHAWPSFFYNLCPGPLWSSSILGPSTSYSIHFFTQSSSSFLSTCPYHRSLFCCSTNVISSVPNLSLSSPHLEVCLLP